MDLTRVETKSPSGAEGRRSPRFRVLLNAQIVTTSDEQAVKVKDISTGGAMLQARRPIPKDEDVILRRGTIEHFARVLWTSGDECGVEFDDKLTDAEMIGFIQEPAGQASFVPEPFKARGPAEDWVRRLDGASFPIPGGPIGSGLFGR